MEQQLDKLTQLGSEAVQVAVTHYTHWYVIYALCWLTLGLLCIVAGVKCWLSREHLNREYYLCDARLMAIGLLAIAALIAVFNLPTLLEPRAIAIHRLINDAR